MWQKIARLIHHVDGGFALGNADVHVQTEDEIRARELLHILNNFLITLAFGDELISPMRKRMGAARCDFQPAAVRESRKFASQIDDVSAGIDNRLADFRAE